MTAAALPCAVTRCSLCATRIEPGKRVASPHSRLGWLYGDWTPQQEIDNPVSMIPDSLFRILHFTVAILTCRTLLPATGLQDPFPERQVIAPAQLPVLQRILRSIAVEFWLAVHRKRRAGSNSGIASRRKAHVLRATLCDLGCLTHSTGDDGLTGTGRSASFPSHAAYKLCFLMSTTR